MKAQDLYQAAHHELVASALATKIGHEIDSENKIGCMVLGLTSYPRTCNPGNVIATMERVNVDISLQTFICVDIILLMH